MNDWFSDLIVDINDVLTSLPAHLSGDSLSDQLQADVGLVLGGIYQLHDGNILLVVFLDLHYN